MTKKQRTAIIIERLREAYPDATCTLEYDEAWKLLVEVRLAAQCTDARVNIVVQDLYAKYPTVAALAEAKPEDVEAIVRPCGLGRSKAKDICACMKVLHEKYQDNVPDDFDALLALPGVGRKSANLIMGDVFGKPAIVTDTHCIRLVNRMGLVDGEKDPKKVGMASHRKRAVIYVTGWYIMAEMCAVRARSRIVMCAVCRIFVRNVALNRQEAIHGSQI